MKQKQILGRGIILMLAAVMAASFSMPAASAVTSELAPEQAASNANGAFNINISPPSVGIEVVPGATVSTDIRIQNQGLATENVKVSLMKFSARGQDGTPQLEELADGDEFAKWATFSTNRFSAEPNVWKTVTVTVSPPADAAFGYYYAVIFSRDGAEQQVRPEQANLLGALASLVLLDVKAPGAVRRVNVTEFSTTRNAQEYLPVDFTVRLRNTGNTHVAARGNIIISKGGKNVALLEVNLKKGFILPDSYRKFNVSWTDGTPVYQPKTAGGKTVLNDKGQAERELSWDKFSLSKLRMGKYDAKLVMVYDDGKRDVATEASLSFWVIPWRIIGGATLVGLLVLAGLWSTVLRPLYRKSKQKRDYAARR